MPNDLAMLAWAGTSYAVANAPLEAAEPRGPGGRSLGVAAVLAKVLGL